MVRIEMKLLPPHSLSRCQWSAKREERMDDELNIHAKQACEEG